MSEEVEVDPWAVLSQVSRNICEQCEHSNPRSAQQCEECGADLYHEQEDEEFSLNLMVGGQGRNLAKTPLEKAKHLIRMRETVEGVLAGRVSDGEFKTVVMEYYRMMSYANEYLKSNRMKASLIDDLESPDRALADRLIEQVNELYESLVILKSYLDHHDQGVLHEGYARFESAMRAVSAIQGDAYDRANAFEN